MILFLDYDGVLHPDAVFLEKGKPLLRGVPGELFMWAPLLTTVLMDFPETQVVLSTSWVRVLRFSRAKAFLPELIRRRVVGATWHSHMSRHPEASHTVPDWWSRATRYEQIRRYVDRAEVSEWVAVDDHPEGWCDDDLDKLVVTDSLSGLSGAGVMEQLTDKLSRARTS